MNDTLSHAQDNTTEENNHFIPNTITYIAKQERITPSFQTLTTNQQTMVPDHLRDMITSTDEKDSQQKEKDYDFNTDDSLQRYVSRHQGFSDKQYKPNNLVILKDANLVLTQKNMQLRQEAAESLSLLAQEFNETFHKKLVLISAYRSYNYQKNLKDKGCSDTLCAPPGHSEHQ